MKLITLFEYSKKNNRLAVKVRPTLFRAEFQNGNKYLLKFYDQTLVGIQNLLVVLKTA